MAVLVYKNLVLTHLKIKLRKKTIHSQIINVFTKLFSSMLEQG